MNEKIEKLKEMREDLRMEKESVNKEFILYYGKPCNDVDMTEIVTSNIGNYRKEMSATLRQEYSRIIAKIAMINEIIGIIAL